MARTLACRNHLCRKSNVLFLFHRSKHTGLVCSSKHRRRSYSVGRFVVGLAQHYTWLPLLTLSARPARTFLAETVQTTSSRFAAFTRYSGSLFCLSSMLKALSRSSSELSGLLSKVSLRQILCCLAFCDRRPLIWENCRGGTKPDALAIRCAIAVQPSYVSKTLTSNSQRSIEDLCVSSTPVIKTAAFISRVDHVMAQDAIKFQAQTEALPVNPAHVPNSQSRQICQFKLEDWSVSIVNCKMS